MDIPPVPLTSEEVLFLLRGEINGDLHIVESPQGFVGDDIQAVAVGGHGQLDPPILQILHDLQELGVQAVLSRAHAHGADGEMLADGLDLFQGKAVNLVRRTVTVGAVQVAIVGQSDANGQAHHLLL